MRILFSSLGAYGHLFPLVPLALAARELGHQAIIGTAATLHPALAAAGLDVTAIGLSLDEAVETARNRGLTDPADMYFEVFGHLLPTTMMADLQPVLAAGEIDLVVHGLASPIAAIAARLAGVPTAVAAYGRFPGPPLSEVMFPAYREMAAQYGVAVSEPRTMDGPFIDICPPSLQLSGFAPPSPTLLTRPVSWSPPEPLPRVLEQRDPERPLVYVTLGTVFAAPEIFSVIIDGVAREEVDLLVTTGPNVDPAQLGEVPGNVTVLRWAPQDAILPLANVVVHHGGSGTTLGAAGHGIPQLLLPQGGDQHPNAGALVQAGCGLQLDTGRDDAAAVASAVRTLLQDQAIATAARRLAAEIAAMPHPRDTVARLARIIA